MTNDQEPRCQAIRLEKRPHQIKFSALAYNAASAGIIKTMQNPHIVEISEFWQFS
jgi:hypothetical protein